MPYRDAGPLVIPHEIALASGESVALDARRMANPFGWEAETGAGAEVVHHYALSGRPAAQHWNTPQTNAMVAASTVAAASEGTASCFLRWASNGGGSVIRVVGRGLAIFHRSGVAPVESAAGALQDIAQLTVGETLDIPLEADWLGAREGVFDYDPDPAALHYSVASANGAVTAAIVEGAILRIAGAAARAAATAITVTALTPTGETGDAAFNVAAVVAA